MYRDVRVKKKRKRLLQEAQWSKEIDEKPDEKTQDKIKSETDEEKDAIVGIDDESQGDPSESKVNYRYKSNIINKLINLLNLMNTIGSLCYFMKR
jgi:hypothetical protein